MNRTSEPSWLARAIAAWSLRRGVALVLFFAAPLGLHFGAREAAASAVALAPNAGKDRATPGSLAIPSALIERGARPLETRVKSPPATLESWVLEPRAAAPKGTIVLLHGVRMDKRSLAGVGAALTDAGYRTVLVDLRGHGESSGRYLTYGEVEAQDISTVLDSLSAGGVRLGCTGVYGFSYGGAVAVELGARDERVAAVVAVAPFSSLREVVADYRRKYLPALLSFIPDAWFQGAVDEAGREAAFDPDRRTPLWAASRSRANLLLIHGTADTQVPLLHSQRLFRAARGNVQLLTVAGAGHDTVASQRSGLVGREAVAWFDHWFGGAGCSRLAR